MGVVAVANPLRAEMAASLRPVDSRDCEQLRRLFYRMSPQTIYRRFLSPLRDPEQAHPDRLLDIDHRAREALGAFIDGELVGVARFARLTGSDAAEVAIVVADDWQRRGLGERLIGALRSRAAECGVATFTFVSHADNRPALALLQKVFPGIRFDLSAGFVEGEARVVAS